MRKLFLILMTLMVCSWSLMAQTRTYHGTVVDAANGEPLVGATIQPIGGGQGAAADIDGNFTITVPSGVKKAKVSYVGYNPQTVDLADKMLVKLTTSETALENLVVVAYGTATKESLTGSVAVVGAKEIEDRPVTSVTAALEGNAPGVQVNNSVGQPGSSPTIRIRGFNSINGSNTPLYVVDGVPFDGTVADLNPADIESMSVLKDAASSALYGNRGANGVILITTKKAKKVGRVDVTLQVRQGMYNRGLPFYDRLEADEWMQTAFDAYANGLMSSNPNAYPTRESAVEAARQGFVSTYAKANIYGVPDNEVFNEQGKLAGTYLPGYADDLDWWKAVSRSGYRQEYNLNAAAATDVYNIFASVGYLKENGYMLQTDFERFNARINANFNPVSYLKFGVNLAATSQESEYDDAGGTAQANNPFLTMYTAPIYPYYSHDENGNVIYENGSPVWNVAPYLESNNVAWSMRLDSNNNSANVIDGSLYGTAVIPYGFELTVRGTMHRDKSHGRSYMNNLVGSAVNAGSLATAYVDVRSHTFMQTLTWEHLYGDHHVDALLDHENWNYFSTSASVNKREQSFPDIPYLSNFESLESASESAGQIRTESYLGRARYNYDQKYFGEFSFRRDGTSRFSKPTRWGNFWSVGASWVVSREKFMRNVNWVDYLKLRTAYGSVGNDASAGAYSYWSLYAFMYTIDDCNNLVPAQLAAYDVKWEATKTFDIGLEGALFDDRFNFTVGYFNKRNSDLLFNVTQPISMGTIGNQGGATSVLTNIGTMQNVGWELQFGVDILRTPELLWNFSIDATFMKNKIISLPNGRDIPGQALFQQKSIYEHYNYIWAGVDQLTGRSLYRMEPNSPDYWMYNEDGSIDAEATKAQYEADFAAAEAAGALVEINGEYYTTETQYTGRNLCGTSLPTVYGSFGTNLSWKGVTLGLLFTYSLGGKTYDSNYASLMSVSTKAAAIHKDINKAWTGAPEGMTADSPNRIDPNGVPMLDTEMSQYNDASSSRFLTSSNYLSLKNVNLMYEFPKKWTEALKMQSLNLGVSIDNLFLITARKGMNPQYSFAGGQGANFVPARVFSFQLGVRF